MNELKEELNSLCGVSSERKSVMSPVTSEESGMVSHLMMDETIRQLRGSELRVSELRKRIEEVKKEKEKNESDSNNAARGHTRYNYRGGLSYVFIGICARKKSAKYDRLPKC